MATPFAHLLASHMVRVHRCALGWLGNEQEAREVAQEALTKAWAAQGRYDASRPFYPWLSTIVRNTCRDARARKRAFTGLEADRLPSTNPSPHTALDTAQTRAQLHKALDALDDTHREIIIMRHFEDRAYAEIAQALGVAQGTVMSRLYRARKALVQRMEENA
jgi:RNA polymerase sigma factor (sigma-70 family)